MLSWPSASRIGAMTVAQLKLALKAHGLETSGLKAALASRLFAHLDGASADGATSGRAPERTPAKAAEATQPTAQPTPQPTPLAAAAIGRAVRATTRSTRAA